MNNLQVFHWKLEGLDVLILAPHVAAARAQAIEDFENWAFQSPERYGAVMEGLKGPPLYVADALHTIVIDSRETRGAQGR